MTGCRSSSARRRPPSSRRPNSSHPPGSNFIRPATCPDRVPLQIGAFTVTPFLVDHSGFDSYSLLIEAEGRRLFYSGDFRGHGRKASLFKRLLDQPPLPIDVLLCEGTHIRREQARDEAPRSELDVELSLAKTMSETTGAACVVSSAQNIDRLVTVYRASKRAGRTLVTDL